MRSSKVEVILFFNSAVWHALSILLGEISGPRNEGRPGRRNEKI